ncbi:MAG: hypothetical protein JXB30_08615 [Anaerolineae bacterium]|nr:hypothetical protein [Anaerolineae bacterium]
MLLPDPRRGYAGLQDNQQSEIVNNLLAMLCYNASMIRDAILDYINHTEDLTYLADVFAHNDTTQLVDGIVDLLDNRDNDMVGQVCLFIRDLILVAPQHGLGLDFCDAFSTSAIVPALEKLVLADNHFTRKHAIYTLGKTCSIGSVPALQHAFEELRDRDPIILPGLVFELRWLGLDAQETLLLIEDMITSPQFATRWAALAIVESYSEAGDLDGGEFYGRCFERLRYDDHPLVQAEAEYRYQQWQLAQRPSSLTEIEHQQQKTDLKSHQPAILFWDVSIRHSNHLYAHHIADYSIADLEQFIADMTRAKPDRPAG